ncbi:MAG: protein kinase [Desulfuromonadales bacterium]|nr:protein kinase [Desulfuromonadales bacterium]
MLEIQEQYGLYTVKETLAVSDERACCRASDPFLGHDVVLQLIKIADSFDAEKQQFFTQQLEKLAELNHPALAPIFDIGTEENICFFTTTFFPQGRFFSSLSLPLSEKEGLLVIRQLAEGLTYGHSKGFEHGMLDADDVFADEQGRPVLANFGVNELLESLYGVSSGQSAPSLVPSIAQKQSSYSLGTFYLDLVLAEGEGHPSPMERVVTLKGYREKQLISTLLGMSQEGIPSYDELIRLIDEILDPPEVPVHAAELEHASRDEFDFSLELDEDLRQEEEPAPQPVPSEDPIPFELDDEKPAPAAQEVDSEKQALRDAQFLLQGELHEATAACKRAERELLATQEALEESQKALKKALTDKNIALEMLDNQPPPRHPAVWLIGGCLVGMLAAGSLVYFLFNVWMVPEQELVSHKVSVERQPIVAEAVAANKESRTAVSKPAPSTLPGTTSTPPEQDEKAAERPADTSVTQDAVASPAQDSGRGKVEQQSAEPAPVAVAEDKQAPSPEPPADPEAEILVVLQQWVQAWSKQDVSAYLATYSEDYQPDAGQSLQEWRDARKVRLERPEWIEVNLQDFDFKLIGPEIAEVKLLQKYRSDSYGDQTKKVISLVREDGQWKIWMERSLN